MAFMIPETIDDIYKVTVGEKKVFKMLRDLLPDSYIVWYEPIINNRCPDFVVLGPDIGIVVLEVKDWSIDYIKSGDCNTFRLITNEVKKNPLKQAREYTFNLADKLKQNKYLVEKDGPYKGYLSFTYGYGIIFTEILEESYLNSSIKNAIDPNLIIFKDELNQILVDYDKEKLRERLKLMFPTKFIFPPLDDKTTEIIISEISGISEQKESQDNKSNIEKNKNPMRLLIGLAVVVIIIVFGFYYGNSDKGMDMSIDGDTTNKIILNETNYKESEDSTEPIKIKSINKEMIGEKIVIEGTIISIYEHKNGHLFLAVEDSTGKIQVPVFADKEIDHNIIEVNKEYQITGKVNEYNGELEIIPEEKYDIVEIDK